MENKHKFEINHEYIFTQKQIKKALNLKGDLQSMELHEGLTPTDDEKGKSKEKTRWSIFTVEKEEE